MTSAESRPASLGQGGEEMATPTEQMCSAFVPSGASPVPVGAGLPARSPALPGPPTAPAWPPYPGGESGYSSRSTVASTSPSELRSKGGGQSSAGPQAYRILWLGRPYVCPSETAGNGRTFGLGLRLAPGRVLTGLPAATEILFSPTHYLGPPSPCAAAFIPSASPRL